MKVQVASGGAKKGNATTSGNQRGRRIRGRENYDQKKSTRKEQVFGAIEGMYSRRRHLV